MTLTVYTKAAGCFGCAKTRQKFTDAGLAFAEELGYSQVPVVVYDKEDSEYHWSGLNPVRIAQVIGIETAREGALA